MDFNIGSRFLNVKIRGGDGRDNSKCYGKEEEIYRERWFIESNLVLKR